MIKKNIEDGLYFIFLVHVLFLSYEHTGITNLANVWKVTSCYMTVVKCTFIFLFWDNMENIFDGEIYFNQSESTALINKFNPVSN